MSSVLSEIEKKFIQDNRLQMSMNEMSHKLQVNIYQIRKYMIDNKLQLEKKQVQNLRIKTIKSNHIIKKETGYVDGNWVSDPWNKNLNPVTMLK